MEGCKGGSSTPSYKDAIASRGKSPLGNVRGFVEEEKRNNEKETYGATPKENGSTKDREEEDKSQGTRDNKQKGLCRVVLNNPALQVHREHMGTYAIICKFMGLWPTKKALQTWIKYYSKPKGSIDLHLGLKGLFTVVFTNIEDKDRIFEGGPYFYAAAGLYMQPWMMNFVPGRETFTSVPVSVRLYSLPLD